MRFHRKAHLRLKCKKKKKIKIKPSPWRRMFYSSPRGCWIKCDANTANWINLPPLNRCDVWSLNAQMNKEKFQSLMMLFLFVHFFPSAWWRFQKMWKGRRYQITRRRGGAARGVARSMLQPPGMQWQAVVVEHKDGIKRWVEHIKLISGHAENSQGHADTINMTASG